MGVDPILYWPCGTGEDSSCMTPAAPTGCQVFGPEWTACQPQDVNFWDDMYCMLLNCQWCCIYA